uniref:ATP synthase F0 subunit 8 n=1 Tax=Erpobdella japonica TaxID=184739 RepID=A0A343KJQ9_9ANNE|nr:ATP synthase F0 subunit 8 [Erpobdella japonica]ATG87483.1 ATP synthase F0 subunit 8 [Erpobdella japonica]
MPHLSPMSWMLMFLFLFMLLVIVLSFFWWFDYAICNSFPYHYMKTQSTKKWKW